LHLARQLQRAGLPRHLPSLVTLLSFTSCQCNAFDDNISTGACSPNGL
jgi:hypothetical protein